MMIPCNYYINVAKQYNDNRYYHFCKIELGDLIKEQAMERCNELFKLFPKSDGWELTLYYVECKGQKILTSN